MAAILVPYGAWIPLALVLSTAPALGVALWSTLRLHQWRLATTAAQRRTYYYDWLLTDREAAAEVRLFGLAGPFRRAYQAIRRKLHGEQVALLRNQAIADLAAGVIAVAVLGAVLASMVWRALRAHLPLGDLALVYQAFSQGQSLLRTLLGNAGQLYANSLFLENLFDFLALEPRVREPREPASAASRPPRAGDRPRGVRFERVTFRYPGAARPALDGFTLEIPAGRVAAVVGANGAGKTTLIKLLCRFYDPAEGRVLIDGADARDLPLETLRAAITVLFQEPVRYHESAATNIAYGDWTRTPGMDELQEAAGAAGADVVIARLPEGYEEVLGHWFGGTELSVGEWQRLALARAFLRRAPIVALDEPTSAMDSWAEADWMRRFRALVAGRTALIVTHRFTTAMQADVIHVMEAGRIVESGTHTDLVARGARYAESWLAQVGCTR
jgi:ATP-binding cassette subfamily B protein